jgi:hypothetical protein
VLGSVDKLIKRATRAAPHSIPGKLSPSSCNLSVNLSKLSSTQVLFPEQPPHGTIVYRYLEVLAPVALSTGEGRTC